MLGRLMIKSKLLVGVIEGLAQIPQRYLRNEEQYIISSKINVKTNNGGRNKELDYL